MILLQRGLAYGIRPPWPALHGRPSPPQDAEDEALLAAARRAAAENEDRYGQPITRDALRARLGVSNQAASELLRQLRAWRRPPARNFTRRLTRRLRVLAVTSASAGTVRITNRVGAPSCTPCAYRSWTV